MSQLIFLAPVAKPRMLLAFPIIENVSKWIITLLGPSQYIHSPIL